MIPIADASLSEKPSATALVRATNTPSCDAAPRRKVFGLERRGPKSVIAPMPRKISGGKISSSIPFER
jgi:hypothetical protein